MNTQILQVPPLTELGFTIMLVRMNMMLFFFLSYRAIILLKFVIIRTVMIC